MLAWFHCSLQKCFKMMKRYCYHLYTTFCQHIRQSIDCFKNVSASYKTNPPTSRWLLSHLSNHLGSNVGFICKHKKYGTLLYRKNGDILKALSKALGKAHQTQKSEAHMRKEYSNVIACTHKSNVNNEISQQTIVQACVVLNSRINKQIKDLIDTYHKDPLMCETFDPVKYLQELDPLLVQCIQVLTRPVRERRQLFNHQDLLDSSGTTQSKSMKQLYTLSTIFFCTNSQCNMPLQYLLSDAILCLGGSTELVKILNRIGAVA